MMPSRYAQSDPYRGDVINCYYDGPLAPGALQLGAISELESSSLAAALLPKQSIEVELDHAAHPVFGVPLTILATSLAEAPE
jgi:hypothetical protein